jgi:hypothetical protein
MIARLRLAGLAFAVVAGLSGSARCEDLHDIVQKEFGKEYRVARRHLIETGNIPLDRSRAADRYCYGDVSSMYPECSGCAVDQPLCRFEWRSRSRRRFSIITRGEDPNSLIVSGMAYD